MDKIELLEEFQTNNFLGDIVGELMKQLRAFEEKKAKEREKLVEDSSDDLLQKFDRALEKALAPKKELIAKLKHVYDFYHVWVSGDAIAVRRVLSAFLATMDENILVEGEMPPELMTMQIAMMKEELAKLRNVDEESKEFTRVTGIEV